MNLKIKGSKNIILSKFIFLSMLFVIFSKILLKNSLIKFVLTIFLILIWSINAIHRSPQQKITNWIKFISCFLISWLMITLLKYQLETTVLTRILWYSFYIFTMGLPLSLLYIVLVFDHPYEKTTQIIPKKFIPFLILYPLLLLMVFTNDFTQIVFKFDLNDNWSDIYSYNIGYYIIYIYCIILFIISITILIKKSKRSPKHKSIIFSIITAMAIVIYNTGYALGIPIFRQSSLSLYYSVLVILFLETILYFGLLPVNTHYSALFKFSQFNMKIIDNNKNTILKSNSSYMLAEKYIEQICKSKDLDIYINENILIHSKKIKGGYAIWKEDMYLVNQLNKIIETNIQQIENANLLLLKESDIKRKKISFEIKTELFNTLEKNIKTKLVTLENAANTISTSKNKEKQLTYIIILLCHIKRHCNLFFCAQQNYKIQAYELIVYLDELSELADFLNIKSLVRSDIKQPLDIRIATLIYDFYFEIISWSTLKSHATIIGILNQKENILNFTIISSEPIKNLTLSKELKTTVKNLNAKITVKHQQDSNYISLSLKQNGGNENDNNI